MRTIFFLIETRFFSARMEVAGFFAKFLSLAKVDRPSVGAWGGSNAMADQHPT